MFPPAGPLQTTLLSIAAHSHAHAHSHVLDLNAAWFVSLSHITRKVADQENSPVLLANAYNLRSDASSSVVALVATFGSGWFPALPLDPTGGAYIFTVDIVLYFILLLDRFSWFLSTRPLNIQGHT